MMKTKFQKYAPTLLTILGSVGVICTAAAAAVATPKAAKLLNESEKENEEISTLDKIKIAGPCYIPAASIAVATISCIVGSHIFSIKQQASLMGAYVLVTESYKEYKTKLKELYGEEVHNKIVDSIAAEKSAPTHLHCPGGMFGDSSLDFGNDGETVLFYDEYSRRYFESTIEQVLQAEYHLNRNFVLGADTTVNMFYEFLGINDIEHGNDIGWGYNACDYGWIDFNHRKTVLEDGLECWVIEMVIEPEYGYDEL